MFWNKDEELLSLDAVINKLELDMEETDPTSDEYNKMMNNLERLHKLKAQHGPKKVSPDTIALVACNLIGIAIVVSYEHAHVIGTKALSHVLKPR